MIGPPLWAQKYVGVPYAAAGGSFAGTDCWGLVRLVMIGEKNIALPEYGDTSAADLIAMAGLFGAERKSGRWLKVDGATLRPFDVHTLKDETGAERHCGIMVSPLHLLHVEKALARSAIVPLHHRTVNFRRMNVYRAAELL